MVSNLGVVNFTETLVLFVYFELVVPIFLWATSVLGGQFWAIGRLNLLGEHILHFDFENGGGRA